MEENNENKILEEEQKTVETTTETDTTEKTEEEKQAEIEKAKKEARKHNIKEAVEWIICTIIALIIVLSLKYYIVVPTVVRQSSMYPTLKDGERLILNRTHRLGLNEIERGDIITFETPILAFTPETVDQSNPKAVYSDAEYGPLFNFFYYVIETPKVSYIKRVIGVAGDHIEIKDNKIYLNGEELEEEYLSDEVKTESDVFTNFTVPEGYVFAVGDNRENSVDGRAFGCIPFEKIEGTVMCRFWPLNVLGKVDK